MSSSTIVIPLLAGVMGGLCLAGFSSSSDPSAHTCPSTVDTRDMLLSAARAHGWDGLSRISTDSLSLVGNGTLYEVDLTHDDERQITQFVLQVVLGILLRHQETVISPGILQGISANFVRTGHLFWDATISSQFPIDNTDTITKFITTTTLSISRLVISLIHHIRKFPEVGRDFYHFSLDPISWERYTHAEAGSLSIEQIVHRIHLTYGPLHARGRTATYGSSGSPGPETRSSLVSIIRSLFAPLFRGGGGTVNVDVEAGIGHTGLHDCETEYTAALFVAVLMHLPGMRCPGL